MDKSPDNKNGNGNTKGNTDFDALMLIPFQFNDTEVTAIIDECGEPWFVAKEVCGVLGFTNPSDATKYLDADERTLINNPSGQGGSKTTIINESGLYSLIMRSRKPEAKAFRKWVTSEVLPAIRRTGSYALDETKQFDQALKNPAKMLDLIKHYAENNLVLAQENKAMQPKVRALEQLTYTNGSFNLTMSSKHLDVQRKFLIRWLNAQVWIYRMGGGGVWTGYDRRLKQGFLEQRVYRMTASDGTERSRSQVLITPKGLAKLAELIPQRSVAGWEEYWSNSDGDSMTI